MPRRLYDGRIPALRRVYAGGRILFFFPSPAAKPPNPRPRACSWRVGRARLPPRPAGTRGSTRRRAPGRGARAKRAEGGGQRNAGRPPARRRRAARSRRLSEPLVPRSGQGKRHAEEGDLTERRETTEAERPLPRRRPPPEPAGTGPPSLRHAPARLLRLLPSLQPAAGAWRFGGAVEAGCGKGRRSGSGCGRR